MSVFIRISHYRILVVLLSVLAVLVPGMVRGQVLLEDDFEQGQIDTSRWRIDNRPFETGAGLFEATIMNGQLFLEGTATKNWWGGIALATIPTFSASADEPLTFEVDRVLHERVDNTATGAGQNSSTRTSIWITDVSRTNYVLFSHNSNEGGWTYNKRVGDPDDNATAGGLSIVMFDHLDADFDLHRMGMRADGETVQLLLDGIEGPLVRFPFSDGIVFEVGAYARRGEGAQPTDQIKGTFDNVLITGAGETCISLAPPFTQVLEGESPELTLQLPPGIPRPASVTITSSAPGIAAPEGAVDGVLSVAFMAGDEDFRLIPVEVSGTGSATFSVENDFGQCTSDPVTIYVPGILLEDDFEGDELDEELWLLNEEPFEDGVGAFDFMQENGVVRIFGSADDFFWPGLAVMTAATFSPTPEEPVTFQVDQTLTSSSIGFYRAGVWVTNGEDEFIFFSFVRGGASDWVVNSSTFELWPALGEGTDLAAYNCCTFNALDVTRRLELIADGETVSVVMDGVIGGVAPFEFDEVVFGFGAYAAGSFDSVEASFDNARVLGPSTGPPPITLRRGDGNNDGKVNISDASYTLNHLFLGGPGHPCEAQADSNGDGRANISDASYTLNHLFLGGPAPPAPFPDCGEATESDLTLGCAESECSL